MERENAASTDARIAEIKAIMKTDMDQYYRSSLDRELLELNRAKEAASDGIKELPAETLRSLHEQRDAILEIMRTDYARYRTEGLDDELLKINRKLDGQPKSMRSLRRK